MALEMFRGSRRVKVRARRVGDEHFYACKYHLDHDQRMARLQSAKTHVLGGTHDRL
jgi:hypothetical protein